MKICYFGTYEKDYPRNRVLIKSLIRDGAEVVECHFPLWERQEHKTGSYLVPVSLARIAIRLFIAYLVLTWKFIRVGDFDCLIVGYIGQADVFLARFLLFFRKRPLVFNPLVSMYDTLVKDRMILQADSLAARFAFRIDQWAFQLSDMILMDTNAHGDYVAKLFGIDRNKFFRVFVGADEDVFFPRPPEKKEDSLFRVLFYGKFIPLHGIHHILEAAKALETDREILFEIIGKGQLSAEIHDLATRLKPVNTKFIDWVPYEQLPHHISRADLCLGIYGDTGKAQRVIPNKVFQILACSKPVLTADTPAIRELGQTANLLLCPSNSAVDLASMIIDAKNNGQTNSVVEEYTVHPVVTIDALSRALERAATYKEHVGDSARDLQSYNKVDKAGRK